MNKIVNPANGITSFRLLLGLSLLYTALLYQTQLTTVLYLIFLGLDLLDGFVARKFKYETDFGKNFDLFTDGLIGFTLGGILGYQGFIPMLYFWLVLPLIILQCINVALGIFMTRKAFIPSKWRKLDGFICFSTILLFLIDQPFSDPIAYAFLIPLYFIIPEHFISLLKRMK
ncbi:MAG: CDP-alcohol phosphatidyltransferase family protein [Candidatus Nanoarchaeia archaeon]